ncbi:tapetal oleosin GRP-16-like [Miscanthus floridulus]|uniref:tapetal oleosin GRP-16-like n=1 Tax=Miscanthus floridulus TaxID=154761 RepID=UPI00345B00BD
MSGRVALTPVIRKGGAALDEQPMGNLGGGVQPCRCRGESPSYACGEEQVRGTREGGPGAAVAGGDGAASAGGRAGAARAGGGGVGPPGPEHVPDGGGAGAVGPCGVRPAAGGVLAGERYLRGLHDKMRRDESAGAREVHGVMIAIRTLWFVEATVAALGGDPQVVILGADKS